MDALTEMHIIGNQDQDLHEHDQLHDDHHERVNPTNDRHTGPEELIDLCSLCNRQFSSSDEILESLHNNGSISAMKATEMDRILNVFLANDDDRSLILVLCPNCKNLCESLIRTKHSVSSLIDHITSLLLQNSRFKLINSKDVIVSELFSAFNPYSSASTASLILLQDAPHDLGHLGVEPSLPSMEEFDRHIADLECQFDIEKLKAAQSSPSRGLDDDVQLDGCSSSCSLPSIGLLETSSLSGTPPKEQASPNSIMNVNVVGNFGASIDILKRRRQLHLTPSPDHHLPPIPHLIADTDNDELELCFSKKLAQQKETETELQRQQQLVPLPTQNNGDKTFQFQKPASSISSIMYPAKSKPPKNAIVNTGNPKTFACAHCSRICKTKKDFDIHMGHHLQERKYVCDICGTAYRRKRGLDVHLALHKGEAEFKCDHCNKVFTQKSGLQRHLPIHTGVLGFQCEVCGRRFLYQTSYNAHKQTHNSAAVEKKFKCPICPRSFPTNYKLKRHNNSHTGSRPLHCTVCGKTFAEKYNLDAHVKTHSTISSTQSGRRFRCSSCDFTSDRRANLDAHVLKTHQESGNAQENK